LPLRRKAWEDIEGGGMENGTDFEKVGGGEKKISNAKNPRGARAN